MNIEESFIDFLFFVKFWKNIAEHIILGIIYKPHFLNENLINVLPLYKYVLQIRHVLYINKFYNFILVKCIYFAKFFIKIMIFMQDNSQNKIFNNIVCKK